MAENTEHVAAASESGREIITPRNLTSAVWRFFGFWAQRGKIVEPRHKVICKLCKVELAYHSTTSNMRAHLSTAHPGELESGPTAKQPRLDYFLKPAATSSLAAPRQEAITEKLVKFVCKGMRPISVVEDVGFKEFCREMEPRYHVPSRGTVTSRIADLYKRTVDQLKLSLQGKDVALTTDGWTSLSTASYVTATAHWINEDWEILNSVLQTKELKVSHTAENVGQCLAEILCVYGLKESVICVTTDNATNYINAVENHLEMVNIPCVAHTINLAVRKGLAVRGIEIPIARLKVAAAHFSKSSADSYLLQKKQELLGLKAEKLINDCPTRWNSTYDMVCRASAQQAAVSAVIFDKKLSRMELSMSEWSIMEKVQEILKPFKVATEALSTDAYPTASAVLPIIHVLLAQLKRTPSEEEPPALLEMKAKIATDLKKRYGEERVARRLLNKASYLDPRFHQLRHLEEDQKRQVHLAVLEEMKANVGGGRDEAPERPREQQPKSALTAMESLFGGVCDTRPNQEQDISLLLQKEMSMYEQESPIPPQENPLMWWKTSGGRYPHIAQMAKKYLSIPGSSVRSERVFSSAGNIVNKKRSALAPSNVDYLVFLANNL
ncbi:E3 SUMO-protein ligase ZBED1-like [Anoplopoma fimbria]|uniref:E3 SUMO-protein ligase ZBED1-like n=1 Tax=Anoplopoma fimbria TaxID=229290 RepID=UPI0023EC008B|nr:E3 SUMO-protein ligase ZBED1-like [Anoplopoma fimbria]